MARTEARGRVRTETGTKRVRVYHGGELIADTTSPLLVWEKPYYPTYYLPAVDVNTELLVPTGDAHHSPSRGDAEIHTVKAGDKEAAGAARWYKESPIEGIAGHISFRFNAMDAWFEEDEQIYVHPRDPYTRVDVLPSSRRVQVVVDGVEVADTTNARFLYETGLPTRYYIPKTDVRMDLLEPTEHKSECPYKGVASYYDLLIDGERLENLVWWYPFPTEESARIAGLVCFYNEKVDIYVDGEALGRPRTVFS